MLEPSNPRVLFLICELHGLYGSDFGLNGTLENIVCLNRRLPKCSVELDSRNKTQTENKTETVQVRIRL